MSLFTDTIRLGFEELVGYAETSARFGDADYPCLQGETDQIEDLVLGGIDDQLDGVLVFSKNDFGVMPKIGNKFIYDNQYLRVETISTDLTDPTFTIAFSKTDDLEGVPEGLSDPSVPCLFIDGGVPDHECNNLLDGGEADHRC